MHAKMPDTPWPIWLSVIVMSVVIVGLCRASRWFYLVAVPFALLIIYNRVNFLVANIGFRNAMIQELGFGYFVPFACSSAVPIVALAAYAYYDFRFRQRHGPQQVAGANLSSK
jgi:hypothetical protein